MKNTTIKGSIFLYIPIVIVVSYYLIYPWYLDLALEAREFLKSILVILFCFYNIVAVFLMICHYNNDDGKNIAEELFYTWDLDNWFYNKERLESIKPNPIWSTPFPFIRLLSPVCWLIYILCLLHRWFNENLTIKL